MKIDVVGIRLVKEREIDYDKSIHQPIDTVNFVLEEMQDLDREMCREQGLADYYPVQDVKDAFKTMEYIDEKEAIEIVLNDSEETLIYHKSPEEECFTKEALKHETINFDKESKMEEDLDELEK